MNVMGSCEKSYIFAIYDSKFERFGDLFVSGLEEFCDMLSNCYENRELLYGENLPPYFRYPSDYFVYNLGTYNRGSSLGDGCVLDVSSGPRVLAPLSSLLNPRN